MIRINICDFACNFLSFFLLFAGRRLNLILFNHLTDFEIVLLLILSLDHAICKLALLLRYAAVKVISIMQIIVRSIGIEGFQTCISIKLTPTLLLLLDGLISVDHYFIFVIEDNLDDDFILLCC